MKDYLNQNTNALLEEFWKFSKETEKMIEKMSLPIVLGDYVEKLGLDVVYDDKCLFSQDKKDFGLIDGKTIYVNPYISYKDQRWVIAKAVALFLSGYNTENGFFSGERFFSIGNPFFVSRNVEEFYLDSLAILLLLPITLFKQEIDKKIKRSEYYQNCKVVCYKLEDDPDLYRFMARRLYAESGMKKLTLPPEDFDALDYEPIGLERKPYTYDLLQELSDTCQIPLFQLSIGYQLIKQMICFQRKKEFEECNYDVKLFPTDEYENIFY